MQHLWAKLKKKYPMKIYLICIFVLLSTQFSFGQFETIHERDTLYVLAKNGLNLRSAPTASGAVVQKLENGEPVVVLELTKYFEAIENRYGLWIRVESLNRKSIAGYVYAGYLTKLSPPTNVLENCYNLMGLKNWLLMNQDASTIINSAEYSSKGYDLDGKDRNSINWTTYANGTTVYSRYGYEDQFFGVETHQMGFNDLVNFLEVYFVLRQEKCQEEKILNFVTNQEELGGKFFTRLHCVELGLTANQMGNRLHIELGIEDF